MAVWVNHGNTGTQDGTTWATGWDSINDALDNLGGDTEIRCAYSGDHDVLSGTLAWVDGSSTINTSVDLSGSLSAGDFIAKSDFQSVDGESIWEIASITGSAITLTDPYVGDTETISGNFKISTFDNPANEIIDIASIGITGGWNSTDTTDPTGITFLRKTGARAGNGIYLTSNATVLSNFGCLRYDRNLFLTNYNHQVNTMYLIGANDESLYATGIFSCIFDNIYSCCSTDDGMNLSYCNGNRFGKTYLYCNLDGIVGSSFNNIFQETHLKRNADGISASSFDSNRLVLLIAENNTNAMISYHSYSNIINTATFSGNTNDFSYRYSRGNLLSLTTWYIGNYNTTGPRQLSEYGEISKDIAEARSDQCVKFDPSDATYYIQSDIADIPVDSGSGITTNIYMKDDVSFSGDVELSLWFMGAIIEDWTAKTMTTSYVQQSISCVNGDITEDGVVTLKCRVRGTAGNVYADDVSVS